MGFSRQEDWSGVPLPSQTLLVESLNSVSLLKVNLKTEFLITWLLGQVGFDLTYLGKVDLLFHLLPENGFWILGPHQPPGLSSVTSVSCVIPGGREY